MQCLYISLHLRKEIITEFHFQCLSVADALHNNVHPEVSPFQRWQAPSPLEDETSAPGHPQAAEGTEGEHLGKIETKQ